MTTLVITSSTYSVMLKMVFMSVDQLVCYQYGMGKQMMNEKQNILFMAWICMCVVILTHIIEDLQSPERGTRITKFKKIQSSRQAQMISL